MKKSRLQHPLIRQINFAWQALLVYAFFGFFWLMPLSVASTVGSIIGRTLGPVMGISRRARKNIALAFPGKTETERKQILVEMWDNLGRVAAESAHLRKFTDMKRIDVSNIDHMRDIIAQGRSCMMVSGHFGNWEISPIAAWHNGTPLSVIYRRPNNPYVDWLVRRQRRAVTPNLLPKGHDGARGLMRALKSKQSVGLLVDQKMNEGIAVPLFGRDAMTGQVPAQLALLTNAAIIPAAVIRDKGCHFRVIVHEEIKPHPDLSGDEQVRYLTTRMNEFLESHIRAYPGQWLWLHRRWGDL